MKIEALWSRNLHQAVWKTDILLSGNFIYILERVNYATKVDVLTGKVIWSQKLAYKPYYLELFSNNLYCFNQLGEFSVLDKNAGNVLNSIRINSEQHYVCGYIVPSEKMFITGGWRGYTDLVAYELPTLNKIWTKSIKSQNNSAPMILDNKFLLHCNHSHNVLEIIELMTGKVIRSLDLPEDIKCPDLGRSYQIIDNQITFISSSGTIYILNSDYTKLNSKKLNIDHISSTHQFFFNDGIIYHSPDGNYNLYRFSSQKNVWSVKLANNLTETVKANQLGSDKFILGGSFGNVVVVSDEGRIINKLPLENRITTEILKIDDILIFGDKGQIKALKYYE